MEGGFARWQHLMVQRISGLVLWALEASHLRDDPTCMSGHAFQATREMQRADFLAAGAGRAGLPFPKGKLPEKAELTHQLAGITWSQLCQWSVNDYCFMVWTPRSHVPHGIVKSMVRATTALDKWCHLLPDWPHLFPLLSSSLGDNSFKKKMDQQVGAIAQW